MDSRHGDAPARRVSGSDGKGSGVHSQRSLARQVAGRSYKLDVAMRRVLVRVAVLALGATGIAVAAGCRQEAVRPDDNVVDGKHFYDFLYSFPAG